MLSFLPVSLQYLLAFLLAIVVLVSVHELGHYWVARWCGVRVLRFSIGLGKPVWRYQAHPQATEWVLALIPLGGYVKMLDAREPEMAELVKAFPEQEFTAKSVWRRMAIVAAGPVANFLLAASIFSTQFLIGMDDPVAKLKVETGNSLAYQAGLRHGDQVLSLNQDPVQSWTQLRWKLLQAAMAKQDSVLRVSRVDPDRSTSTITLDFRLPTATLSAADLESDLLPKLGLGIYRAYTEIAQIEANGAAAKAGLQVGDVVTALDGQAVLDRVEFATKISQAAQREVHLEVVRNKEVLNLLVTPDAKLEAGVTVGRIAVALSPGFETTRFQLGVGEALIRGFEKMLDSTALTFRMLGRMLMGDVSWRNITGPITIADYAGQTARVGFFSYISLIAMLSISLGVMNLLPIPVLDGGHLLYYSLEVLTGKQIPAKYLDMAQRGGLVVLLCLMGVAMFNDLVRQLAKFVQ